MTPELAEMVLAENMAMRETLERIEFAASGDGNRNEDIHEWAEECLEKLTNPCKDCGVPVVALRDGRCDKCIKAAYIQPAPKEESIVGAVLRKAAEAIATMGDDDFEACVDVFREVMHKWHYHLTRAKAFSNLCQQDDYRAEEEQANLEWERIRPAIRKLLAAQLTE